VRAACEHHFMSWLKALNFSVFCAALSFSSVPVMISLGAVASWPA